MDPDREPAGMAQATRDAEVAPPHSKNHLDMVPPTEPAVLHDSTLRVASYGARAAALPTLHSGPVPGVVESKVSFNFLVGHDRRQQEDSLQDKLFRCTGVNMASHSRGLQSKSRLLNPDFPFVRSIRMLSTVLLLYVAIVVQIQVGFYWHATMCDRMYTESMDIFIDCFFMLEVCLNFYTGVWYEGIYHDRWRFIVQHYLRTSFCFDAVTSVPVAIIESVMRQYLCVDGDATSGNDDMAKMRIMRMMKPLRIFKLLRLLKASKINSLLELLDTALNLPVFVTRMAGILGALMFVVHTCVCLYWLVKEASSSAEELDEWMSFYGLKVNAEESLFNKYVLAWYFINTIFSTVGFGDIKAESQAERIFMVAVMYLGIVVFGSLLSEVQNACEDMYHLLRNRSRLMLEVRQFLRDVSVPQHLLQKVMVWLDFDYSSRQRKMQEQSILEHVPLILRRSLTSHLHSDMLVRIPCFFSISSFYRYELMIDLYSTMNPVTFPKGMPIATRQSVNDKVWVICDGTVSVADYYGQCLSVLRPRDFFGDVGMLGVDSRYRVPSGVAAEYFSNSMLNCLVLTRRAFRRVVANFPREVSDELAEISANKHLERQHQARARQTLKPSELRAVTRWACLISKVQAIQVDRIMSGRGAEPEFLHHLCEKLKFRLKGGWGLHWYGGEDHLPAHDPPNIHGGFADFDNTHKSEHRDVSHHRPVSRTETHFDKHGHRHRVSANVAIPDLTIPKAEFSFPPHPESDVDGGKSRVGGGSLREEVDCCTDVTATTDWSEMILGRLECSLAKMEARLEEKMAMRLDKAFSNIAERLESALPRGSAEHAEGGEGRKSAGMEVKTEGGEAGQGAAESEMIDKSPVQSAGTQKENDAVRNGSGRRMGVSKMSKMPATALLTERGLFGADAAPPSGTTDTDNSDAAALKRLKQQDLSQDFGAGHTRALHTSTSLGESLRPRSHAPPHLSLPSSPATSREQEQEHQTAAAARAGAGVDGREKVRPQTVSMSPLTSRWKAKSRDIPLVDVSQVAEWRAEVQRAKELRAMLLGGPDRDGADANSSGALGRETSDARGGRDGDEDGL